MRLAIHSLSVVVTLRLLAAEPAVLPEPGPENGGLRMRLMVTPQTGGKEFDVRVDLLNTLESAITLRADWEGEDTGDLKDNVEAATSIECVPAIRRWTGGVMQQHRKSSQPEHVLKPGEVLTVRWRTAGWHLKNRVTNPNEVQNPKFPLPGLYSVHATVNVIVSDRMAALRSNEQLVAVGGSHALPKSTLGQLMYVQDDGMTALVNLGSRQRIEPGDQFEYFSKRERGKFTVATVERNYSIGKLEVVLPTNGPSPQRGTELSLEQKK